MKKITLKNEELYNIELISGKKVSYDAAVSGVIIVDTVNGYNYIEAVENLTFEILDERGYAFDFDKLTTRNQEWIKELVNEKILNR